MTTKTLTVTLTERQFALLDLINSVYIEKGGPAWECAQEWDEEFTALEIEGLAESLGSAIEEARK